MTSATVIERIRAELQALDPAEVQIRDDSAAHAGHHGAGGKGHYTVRIVAARFTGLSAVQRHRLVYGQLAALIDSDIHALALEARAPGEGA